MSKLGFRNPSGSAPVTNIFSSSNIGTSAYVQLVASLGNPAGAIAVQNTSAVPILIAVGASSSEVDKFVIAPGSVDPVILPIEIKKGSRISAKSLSATASTGFLCINWLV